MRTVLRGGFMKRAFLKQMTRVHYPGITLRGRELTDEEGADILEEIYEIKQYLRKRKIPEGGEQDNEVALERRSGKK